MAKQLKANKFLGVCEMNMRTSGKNNKCMKLMKNASAIVCPPDKSINTNRNTQTKQ